MDPDVRLAHARRDDCTKVYPSIRPSVSSTHKHSEKKANWGGRYPMMEETAGMPCLTDPSSTVGEGHALVHIRMDSINYSYGSVGPRIDM